MRNSIPSCLYTLKGVVIAGNQIGRTLDFPTANITIAPFILKSNPTILGVYISRTLFKGVLYNSITNIGVRPSLQDTNKESVPIAETHLLQTVIDLYNQEIDIFLLEKLRNEIKFTTLEELKHQISLDVSLAESFFIAKSDN